MTKLSAERLAEIEDLATDLSYRAAIWDTAIHDLLDHIAALQAEHNESQVNMHKMLSAMEAERDALAYIAELVVPERSDRKGRITIIHEGWAHAPSCACSLCGALEGWSTISKRPIEFRSVS